MFSETLCKEQGSELRKYTTSSFCPFILYYLYKQVFVKIEKFGVDIIYYFLGEIFLLGARTIFLYRFFYFIFFRFAWDRACFHLF